MFGWILRANSSNTRCWYCISVPNLAAWNRRSPSQMRPAAEAGTVGDIVSQPLVQEGHGLGLRRAVRQHRMGIREHDVLGVLDEPVVLGMEDVVDGGQADILVGAAVAGDVVRIEQFVVVDSGAAVTRVGKADLDIAVGELPSGTALWAMSARKAWPVLTASCSYVGTVPVSGPSGAAEIAPTERPPCRMPRLGARPSRSAGSPFGSGMKLPYGSVASSGTLPTS